MLIDGLSLVILFLLDVLGLRKKDEELPHRRKK